MSNTGWNVKSWYSGAWNKVLEYGIQLNLSIRVPESASKCSKITTNVRKPWLVYKLCTKKDNTFMWLRKKAAFFKLYLPKIY